MNNLNSFANKMNLKIFRINLKKMEDTCLLLGCNKNRKIINGKKTSGCCKGLKSDKRAPMSAFCKFHSCIVDDKNIDQKKCLAFNCDNYTHVKITCSIKCAEDLGLTCSCCSNIGKWNCRCDFAYGEAGKYKYLFSKLKKDK